MSGIKLIRIGLLVGGCAHVGVGGDCATNPRLRADKSRELMMLESEDQADRSGPPDALNWQEVNSRDLKRRIAVAKIFAEGCFRTAADYTSAALIFQHGSAADHYYQAFVWANEAVKLGAESQRMLAANGIDRYLVKTGHKQLFGTQLSKTDGAGNYCLEPVEPSFPESRRREYLRWGVREQIAFILKATGTKQKAAETSDCPKTLSPTPAGTLPGFW